MRKVDTRTSNRLVDRIVFGTYGLTIGPSIFLFASSFFFEVGDSLFETIVFILVVLMSPIIADASTSGAKRLDFQ